MEENHNLQEEFPDPAELLNAPPDPAEEYAWQQELNRSRRKRAAATRLVALLLALTLAGTLLYYGFAESSRLPKIFKEQPTRPVTEIPFAIEVNDGYTV